MARLILKSPYLKPGGKKSPGGYLKYIATREGVEMAEDTSCHLPATAEQQKQIAKLLKQYRDCKDSHEYQDYLVNPTRGNADAFIRGVMELHGDAPQRDVYLKHIDERPGSNGLFTDEGVPIVLSQVQKEMNDHPGNIWTHIISLHREDAERLGYNNTDTWMHLLRSHRNMIAQQMKIAPENFRWYAAFHNEGHHPHVHMMAYSIDPNEAYLSTKGIETIKSNLAQEKLYRKLMNKGRVERIEAEHQPKGLSAKTVRNINQVISSAMDFAVAQKIISENPCKAVALPKLEHKEMQTIPVEQLQAFLQEAKATGVYEMYYIELATGLRRGELLGLRWTDIDWKNGIIKVRRQIARVDGKIVESPLKTKNSYRAVSISPQAIEVLREQKRKTNDQYVFPSPNGGPISPDSVNNMLKRVLERAGIPKVRFHDLRHTFATIALQNGVDIKTVSGMLGHFSAGFTLDTYAHVTTSAQKEAAQTMGNILSL